MRYRRLGDTSLQVSEIGFGAWAIGGPLQAGGKPMGWGPVDDRTSMAAIQRALELGVNFFDTADVYGLGRSEQLLGRTLSGREAMVATKAGNFRREDGESRKDFSRGYLLRAAEASLRRLRREAIDLFQLHNPSLEDIRRGECLEVLEELRRAGKIRASGVSIHKPEEGLALLRGPARMDSLQLAYNLLNTVMAENVLPLALEKKVGVIARVPFQYGLLTGKYDRHSLFAGDDHRSWSLSSELIERGLSLLERLRPAFESRGLTAAQAALKFVLAQPAVSVTIPGAKTPEQVEANASASDGLPLAPDFLREVESALSARGK